MNKELNKECIDEHNHLRALHGCPPLTLDKAMAEAAQRYADHLVKIDRLQHSKSRDCGENLAFRQSSARVTLTGRQATLMWYLEIKDYDFSKNDQPHCGHFSQVVWKASKSAGFGRAVTTDGHRAYFVGQYYPAGNFSNEWIKNVPSPLTGIRYIPTPQELGEESQVPTSPHSPVMELKPTLLNGVMDDAPISHQPERRSQILLIGDQKRGEPILHCLGQKSRVLKIKPSGGLVHELAVEIKETFEKPTSDAVMKEMLEKITFYRYGTEEHLLPIETDQIQEYLTDPQSLLEAFRCEVLHTHNRYRMQHGVPLLKRSEELDRLAQLWAEQLQENGQPSYSRWEIKGDLIGENVSDRLMEDGNISGDTLVKKWMTECADYDYSTELEDVEKKGHFTQVVWKATQHLGIGIAKVEEKNRAFIVCFYHPAGNIINEFVNNVLMPIETE